MKNFELMKINLNKNLSLSSIGENNQSNKQNVEDKTLSNLIENKYKVSLRNKYQYIADLVSIKSYSLSENKEIVDYLITQFSPYAEEIVEIKNDCDDRVNLLIGLNTKLTKGLSPIILSGHIDTVTADEKAYRTCPHRPHCVWQ